MNLKKLLSYDVTMKVIAVVVLLSIALVSAFVIAKPATDASTYADTIRSIDEKKGAVMALTASAATASAILGTVPGDSTTPIANKIMDLSSYLLLVVCVLVLEKSLLTVMGAVSFKFLIPIACAILAASIFTKKGTWKVLAIKIIIFALVLVSIVPLSIKASDLMCEINEIAIEQSMEDLKTSIANNDDVIAEAEAEEKKSIFDKMVDSFKNLVEKVKNGVSAAGKYAQLVLNHFIDTVTLFIVAYCAMPILVVLCILWFIKFLFGINIPIPKENPIKKLRKHATAKDTSDNKELAEV